MVTYSHCGAVDLRTHAAHGYQMLMYYQGATTTLLVIFPVIQVVPLTEWSAKKARIRTNVEICPSSDNGLSKKSVADCLQTRPIDRRYRLVKIRGRLSIDKVQEINQSLRVVFELNT